MCQTFPNNLGQKADLRGRSPKQTSTFPKRSSYRVLSGKTKL